MQTPYATHATSESDLAITGVTILGNPEPVADDRPAFHRKRSVVRVLEPAQARGYDDRGKIEVSAIGSLTGWAGDPVQASPDELIELAVVATVVDG